MVLTASSYQRSSVSSTSNKLIQPVLPDALKACNTSDHSAFTKCFRCTGTVQTPLTSTSFPHGLTAHLALVPKLCYGHLNSLAQWKRPAFNT
ncbi:hypothetical protein DPMN_038820 [Dreissena polymorpha]|uniref:Uncharacterized protein n=1 Tax=Dreissena polymorpha TaxID=45954 RepID=A0A9D4RR38_DREPO|nr:hypothetical protein DPMN_038820 [Dreissena polymorpha]